MRSIAERADLNCKNEEMSPCTDAPIALRVNSDSQNKRVRGSVGMVSMEARVVRAGTGALWDPGERLVGHAAKRRGLEHAIARNGTALKFIREREDQRAVRVGRRA